MNYYILKNEIDSDPLGRGYTGMTDAEVAADMNTIYRTMNRTAMTASEVLNTVDTIEWAALTTEDQRKIWDILHMGGELNPFGNEAQMFISVFGVGSTTISDLAAARVADVSRGTEIGFGEVRESDVFKARAI